MWKDRTREIHPNFSSVFLIVSKKLKSGVILMKELSVGFEINYKKGIFNTEKRATIFHSHVCEPELKETLATIKKELRKAIKVDSSVFLEMSTLTPDYSRTSDKRWILNNWSYRDTFFVEVRTFNGHDYSDVKELNFNSETDMIKFVMKSFEDRVRHHMDFIPVEKGRFAQSLEDKHTITIED